MANCQFLWNDRSGIELNAGGVLLMNDNSCAEAVSVDVGPIGRVRPFVQTVIDADADGDVIHVPVTIFPGRATGSAKTPDAFIPLPIRILSGMVRGQIVRQCYASGGYVYDRATGELCYYSGGGDWFYSLHGRPTFYKSNGYLYWHDGRPLSLGCDS